MANSDIAQSKATSKTSTKTSESYNYIATFDEEKTEELLHYLKTVIGDNYTTSKEEFVWSKISNLETKNDKASIKLQKGKIEINYQNKNGLFNELIIKKLNIISDFIKSTIN
jgi:hypothetical protein